MPKFKSCKVPRLAGFASPTLKDVLFSGPIFQSDQGEAQQFTYPNCWRAPQPGKKRIGSVHVMPMHKGIMVMPQKSAEELALKGDPQAIFKVLTSIASLGIEFVPLPGSMDLIKEIGSKVGDMLDEYDGPFDKDQSKQKYFRTILEDKKTFYMPYVDIVEASFAQFGKETGITLTAEHADGTRDFCSLSADKGILADFLMERRWRQEFELLVVSIVNDEIGGEAFWRELSLEFAQRQSSKDIALDHVRPSDLSVDDIRLRFYMGPNAEAFDTTFDQIKAKLEAAGYREALALTTFFLFETTSRVQLSSKQDDHVVWLAIMTDPKLAGQLLERMQPNLDEFRQSMGQNEYVATVYRRNHVEMLARSARDEFLGRVFRLEPGAFY